MSIVASNFLSQSTLQNLTASGGLLSGCYVGLFQNDVVVTSNMTMSSLTEANFDGYARLGPIEWGSPYFDANGVWAISSGVFQFEASGSNVTNTIYGYFIVGGLSDQQLLFAENFVEPVAITSADSALLLVPQFTAGDPSSAAATLID